MRDILFRGKEKHGEWVEGHYVSVLPVDMPLKIQKPKAVIFPLDAKCNWFNKYFYKAKEVIPETVGQYTGLTDKNGTKIFEGDIVKNDWCFACGYSVIKFGQYKPLDMSNEYQQGHLGFYLEHIHEADKRSVRKDILYFANNFEVIGNIHDNPELIESEVEAK